MKNMKTITILAALILGLQLSTFAQADKATTKFKKYINGVVKKVENADDPNVKRQILNDSFNKMISVFDKVASMKIASEKDKKALAQMKSTITDKQNELNGLDGYDAVKNNQLNNFANYVQQDMEQANETVTISLSVLILGIILLLLL